MQVLMSVPRLLGLTLGTRSAAGASALELRLMHPQHLFGDTICFPLIVVLRLVDRQFRLHRSRSRGMYGNPAEIGSEARRCRGGRAGFGFFSLITNGAPH